MLSDIFFSLLDRSIAALLPILSIALLRVWLKRLPHTLWCILWGGVALRLIIPFSVESIFSLVPPTEPIVRQMENVSDVLHQNTFPIPNAVKDLTADAEHLNMIGTLPGLIWSIGMLAMLSIATIQILRICPKVKEALLLRDNIYLCDHIDSSFILPGIFKPRILLSSSTDESERIYVIAHEEAHIKRLDHIWKPLAFLILAIYWWNPAVWLAYILFCRDIEFACDEMVLRNRSIAWKKPYATALLNQSIFRKPTSILSLAFGEVSAKRRIRNVLHYKKATIWIILASLLCCIIVTVCCLTAPLRTTVDADLDAFISQAILDRERSSATQDRFATESHTVLGVEEGVTLTKVYVMVMYQEYSNTNGTLSLESGGQYPTIITVEKEANGGYSLVDYMWAAKYTDEDWARFPWYLKGRLDTQDYVTEHTQACDRKAAKHFGLAYEEAFSKKTVPSPTAPVTLNDTLS